MGVEEGGRWIKRGGGGGRGGGEVDARSPYRNIHEVGHRSLVSDLLANTIGLLGSTCFFLFLFFLFTLLLLRALLLLLLLLVMPAAAALVLRLLLWLDHPVLPNLSIAERILTTSKV